MSKKVYLVTSGEYSDYQVNGVFSSRQLAEEWIGPFQARYEIDERDLDDMSDGREARSSRIEMGLYDGEVTEYKPNEEEDYQNISLRRRSGYAFNIVISMSFDFYDLDRATKIAGEKRAKILYNLAEIYNDKLELGSKTLYFDRDRCILEDK